MAARWQSAGSPAFKAAHLWSHVPSSSAPLCHAVCDGCIVLHHHCFRWLYGDDGRAFFGIGCETLLHADPGPMDEDVLLCLHLRVPYWPSLEHQRQHQDDHYRISPLVCSQHIWVGGPCW